MSTSLPGQYKHCFTKYSILNILSCLFTFEFMKCKMNLDFHFVLLFMKQSAGYSTIHPKGIIYEVQNEFRLSFCFIVHETVSWL